MKQRITSTLALLALGLSLSLPSFAWNPTDLFRGRTGHAISIVALGAANYFDYSWTVQDVYSGRGHEVNPFLLNNQGVLAKNRLMGLKIGSVGLALGEFYLIHRRPELRPVFTAANWGVAGVLGATAYSNRQVFYGK